MRTVWIQYIGQARAAEDDMCNSSCVMRHVKCFVFIIFRCGFRSLTLLGILRSDVPEGSIGLGRALPPCGVESELLALPEARDAKHGPGALCGRF